MPANDRKYFVWTGGKMGYGNKSKIYFADKLFNYTHKLIVIHIIAKGKLKYLIES